MSTNSNAGSDGSQGRPPFSDRLGSRLLTAAALPVLCVGFAVGVYWLFDQAPIVVRALLAVPAVAIGLALFLLSLYWWSPVLGSVAGYVAMGLACVGLVGGSLLAFGAAELWQLEWRGSTTMCTVLDEHRREETSPPSYIGGWPAETTYYDYTIECAAPAAPDSMTTLQRVSGERIEVAYDPSDADSAVPAPDVDNVVPMTVVSGFGIALWTALTLGLVLSGPPPRSEPDPGP